jgi:hypothetical protein
MSISRGRAAGAGPLLAIKLSRNPYAPGKYRENIDFARFKDRHGAAKHLIIQQTVGQIP